ncbi:hypothetical protein A5819_001939 [Enterococcus sp. 7E2_DIV0204]|uniref:Uncharacterized protein n=1 Tax=Candidatus Enterococcus lemimoniae TaxID=1834167 RepID=A0ABZ2T4Z8_9ENTE|nr:MULTISPECIES: hypothetical protein [unclassified Enterococcus]OTN89447.1 hypothetical protein A5819_001939 [Enterococcus sp. 7E2_DIV0204]OTO68294.1 hypothetical protein A5866_000489 [Enterococcus sp. 12C11_DIV0727]OTP51901.1 hypothetical protein A5884_001096 [Enterococcus sp. 7D2_DIV0200]
MLNLSLVVFFVSLAFLGLAGALYRWRAFTNKKAWNGMVVPLVMFGFVLFVVSLIMIYLNYPK